jgi:hypothetical protein
VCGEATQVAVKLISAGLVKATAISEGAIDDSLVGAGRNKISTVGESEAICQKAEVAKATSDGEGGGLKVGHVGVNLHFVRGVALAEAAEGGAGVVTAGGFACANAEAFAMLECMLSAMRNE